MKIAIHNSPGSFSEGWISYCSDNGIEYKLVDAYATNIIQQVADCDVLMWHFHHANYRDIQCAKSILFALEQAGKKVFPNVKTGWHFDDKVAQKYLLEAIEAPLVPSWVFYDKETALAWAKETTYPKVWKLKGGASAINVKLVQNKRECLSLIDKAFGKGFKQNDYVYQLKDRIKKFQNKSIKFYQIFSPIYRMFKPTTFDKFSNIEKGYVYFQEFIPNNSFDIRLIVIGGKYAYGMKRMNRPNDFRASGSSNFVYDDIPADVLKIAFDTTNKLGLQSVAFDFIFDQNNNPLIIEVSYGFGTKGSSKCPGYYTRDLKFHQEILNPFKWMVDSIAKF